MNVLAVDQGTSSTKALVVDDAGEVLSIASVPVRPVAVAGGVEQDPHELLASVVGAGRAALAGTSAPVGAVALANQGETVMAWDRASGVPDGPAISWQDRRAVELCEGIDPAVAERLTRISGLPLDPYFSAPKMAWLRPQVASTSVITTTDTWLLHQLCGAFVTDVTTASRSMLLDLTSRGWSQDACDAFDLDATTLPEIVGCATSIGHTDAFGPRLEVVGLAVDQQAALVGERCLAPGEAKCTYGTGAFLLMACGAAPVHSSAGLSASVAWSVGEDAAYCLDGQSYTAGAVIGWLVTLGLLDSPEALDATCASVPDAGGVTVVPSLAGLGAPWWQPGAQGLIEGLGLHVTKAHLVRAVVEGLAAQVALLGRSAASDLGAPLGTLRVDGGLARSSALLQAQADLNQAPVEVFPSPHATALGVATLSQCGLDPTRGLSTERMAPAATYEPRLSAPEAEERLARFDAAARRSIEAHEEARS